VEQPQRPARQQAAAEEVVVEQPQRPARQQAAAEEVVVEQPQRPSRPQVATEEAVVAQPQRPSRPQVATEEVVIEATPSRPGLKPRDQLNSGNRGDLILGNTNMPIIPQDGRGPKGNGLPEATPARPNNGLGNGTKDLLPIGEATPAIPNNNLGDVTKTLPNFVDAEVDKTNLIGNRPEQPLQQQIQCPEGTNPTPTICSYPSDEALVTCANPNDIADIYVTLDFLDLDVPDATKAPIVRLEKLSTSSFLVKLQPTDDGGDAELFVDRIFVLDGQFMTLYQLPDEDSVDRARIISEQEQGSDDRYMFCMGTDSQDLTQDDAVEENPFQMQERMAVQDYDPCANKVCGDLCNICPPNNPDCVESAGIKQCDQNNECVLGTAICDGNTPPVNKLIVDDDDENADTDEDDYSDSDDNNPDVAISEAEYVPAGIDTDEDFDDAAFSTKDEGTDSVGNMMIGGGGCTLQSTQTKQATPTLIIFLATILAGFVTMRFKAEKPAYQKAKNRKN
ncbi:hypothetical protein KJ708_00755, partial [bacterium]|nr:hypothetical protein [bacterium]MBU1916541.1 hypothetical protein [bacterium]